MKKYILILFFMTLFNNVYAEKFITHCDITTYSQGTITYDGTKINQEDLKSEKIKYVAISPDLMWKVSMGDIIEIEGLGRFEVHDKTSSRLHHTIDILQHYSKKHFKLNKVKVTLIKKIKRD